MILILVGLLMLGVLVTIVLEARGRGYSPTRRELVVGGVGGLATAALAILFLGPHSRIPYALETTVVFFVVAIPAATYVKWRWGEQIARWFRE